jgi:hypothetical protein
MSGSWDSGSAAYLMTASPAENRAETEVPELAGQGRGGRQGRQGEDEGGKGRRRTEAGAQHQGQGRSEGGSLGDAQESGLHQGIREHDLEGGP